ncbi:1832_t:CDS:1 [Paraglomus brasilianum]|uniref:1832_t:CDS:1 n=1 Tax=Paraglomus brasilianum TaxID=144538 RepID=A0A9N9E1F1_9GLOM|nr:1832_t:CDS:1 [Paraglomus brasilianum]
MSEGSQNLSNKGTNYSGSNISEEMATIDELANTIDGYLNIPGTNRTILSNQIKRVKRQIRRKYNNLQTDLTNEQQRRYNAEAERDLRQTELRNTEADLNLMIITYSGEVKERRRWYYSYKDKHRHVINLQRDKFTLHLLLQRYKKQLNTCRTENGLLEYNRDRIFDRYEKWKNKTKDERQITLNQNQNILNLQQQNLALQNNNQQNRIMATNQLPTYSGDENLEEFLAQFRAEVEARGINVADGAGAPAGRDVGKGLLRGCMRGRLLEWYDENITTKQNFELCNLLDNTGQATIQLVAGRTAVQIGNQAINQANGRAGDEIIPLRANANPWNEDWSIAGGRPTNDPVNAPNANNGQTVVVAGIRFGQAVWLLKTHSPPIEEETRALIYGSLVQGDNSVEEFVRRVKHAGRILGYRDEDLRRKFLDGLVPEWLEKAEDIGEDMTFGDLTKD